MIRRIRIASQQLVPVLGRRHCSSYRSHIHNSGNTRRNEGCVRNHRSSFSVRFGWACISPLFFYDDKVFIEKIHIFGYDDMSFVLVVFRTGNIFIIIPTLSVSIRICFVQVIFREALLPVFHHDCFYTFDGCTAF